MIPPPPPHHHHHHHHDLHRRRRRPHRCHHCHRCHYTIVIIGPQQRVNNRKDHPSPAEKATATVSCSLPSWESKSLIPAVASETSSLWPTECGYCCCCWWCWWWLLWWWWRRRRKQFRRRRWQWHCDVYSSQKKQLWIVFFLHIACNSHHFLTQREEAQADEVFRVSMTEQQRLKGKCSFFISESQGFFMVFQCFPNLQTNPARILGWIPSGNLT